METVNRIPKEYSHWVFCRMLQWKRPPLPWGPTWQHFDAASKFSCTVKRKWQAPNLRSHADMFVLNISNSVLTKSRLKNASTDAILSPQLCKKDPTSQSDLEAKG